MTSYNGATTEGSNVQANTATSAPYYTPYGASIDSRIVRLADTSFADGYASGLGAGYANGEIFGFSSKKETGVRSIKPGETDPDKKTVYLRIYSSTGLPASGLVGEGSICSPGTSEKQVNRDSAGYFDSTGTFTHVGDGLYKYIFADAEVSVAGGEGTSVFRVKTTGFRTATADISIAYSTDAIRSDIVSVQSAIAGVATDIDDVSTQLTSTQAALASDIADIATDVSTLSSTVTTGLAGVSSDVAEVKSDTALLTALSPKIDALYLIGVGRWKIQGTQLIVYQDDGETPLMAFNLFDGDGEPSATAILERVPVP